MAQSRNKPFHQPSAAGGQNDLTRLLETEARLDEILRRTREEAARLVAAAQENAVAREAAVAPQLGADAHRLEEALEAEYRHRAAEARAEASREAERLDRVEGEQVAPLARYVVSRAIGTGP